MKKRSLFFCLMSIGVLISCYKQVSDCEVQQCSQSDLQEIPKIEYRIVNHSRSVSEIKSAAIHAFPQKNITELHSVNEDGQVVLYVANFDDGWAIMAADDRADNVILAYDEEGSFDPDNITNPEFYFWFEMTKCYYANLSKDIDLQMVEPRQSTLFSTNEEDYYWIRMHVRDEETIVDEHVNHILNTKWGQDSPWNYRCPYVSGTTGNRRKTGCVATATAQILYHLKTTKSFPIGLYDNIVAGSSSAFDAVNKQYSYWSTFSRSGYHNPSSRWVAMAKNKDEEITQYVGDLMIDIGEHVGMKYYKSASGTSDLSGAFQYYSVQFDMGAYDFYTVKDEIDAGYPVMVGAKGIINGELVGHAWVIDGYHNYKFHVDHVYKWYMAASDSLSYYNYTHCYTEAQKQMYVPNVNEGDIEHEYSDGGSQYLLMNWGWDGENDNVKCWFSGSNWPVSNNSFVYNPIIVHNFRYEED